MRFGSLALVFAAAGPLLAQERPPPAPPPLWSGKGELSFVATPGDSEPVPGFEKRDITTSAAIVAKFSPS